MKYNLEELVTRSADKKTFFDQLHFALEGLPPISEEGPWLAGGALRRLVQNTEPLDGDMDFFFKDEEQFEEWCKDMERAHDARLIGKTEHNTTYEVVLPITSSVSQGKDPDGAFNDAEFDVVPAKEVVRVQGIHFRYYESVEAVIDSFDFTICQFGFDGIALHAGEYSLWDLARKKLALHKLSFGVSTVRRLLKYQTQGYTACGGCLTAILNAVVQNPNLIQSDVKYLD